MKKTNKGINTKLNQTKTYKIENVQDKRALNNGCLDANKTIKFGNEKRLENCKKSVDNTLFSCYYSQAVTRAEQTLEGNAKKRTLTTI